MKKFNIIDFLFIVFLILCVVVFVNKLNKPDVITPNVKKDKIIITYALDDTPIYIADSIKEGSTAFEQVQTSDFGKVISIDKGPSKVWAKDEKGNLFESTREEHKSISVKLEANAVVKNDSFYIDKADYYIGQQIELNIGNTSVKNGIIKNIEVAE